VRVGLVVRDRLSGQMLRNYLAAAHGIEPHVLAPDTAAEELALPLDVALVSLDRLAWAVEAWPEVPLLALQAGHDPATMAQALRDGATGVIDGSASLHDVTEALHVVAQGEAWIPAAAVAAVLAALSSDRQSTEREAVLSLSPREREVLRLVGRGLTRREIAQHLVVSPHTARTHLQNLLLKLGVHSQVAVAAVARRAEQNGWLDADPNRR
jgi:DNA-binding NarL/FixJ family response regulator